MEADTGTRAFVDLHCHSRFSFDSISPLGRIMATAVSRGLTHLAITDHERIDGALEARERAPDGLTIIIGEEIRSADGDVVGLFLTEAVPPGMSALETIAAIHGQGGLAGIPHPFDRFRSSGLKGASPAWLDTIAEQVDYIEAFNARVPYPSANEQAAAFALQHTLPGVASSDAHSLLEVGIAYNVLRGPIDTAAQLRAALVDLSLVMQRGSYAARSFTPVAKLINRFRGNHRIQPAIRTGTPGRQLP